MKWLAWVFLGVAILGAVSGPSSAQTAPRSAQPSMLIERPRKTEVNDWTIGLAGGLLEGTLIRYAADIAKALDDGENLRVLPIVTFGAVNNVNDLLNLRGIDAALTQADVLDYFKRELKVPGIENKVRYISPLFRSEVHIYAREEFRALKDLEGQKVSFGLRGTAASLTGQIIFQRLNIKVEPVFIDNAAAVDRMRSGDVAAVVQVVGKPNALFAGIKPEPGFHFLPVDYGPAFEDYYVPAALSAQDYPALVAQGEEVSTIAVQTMLATYNWPANSDRYPRIARFVEAFFTKFERFENPPFQPKWRDVNLAGTVPGWTRHPAAEQALSKLAGGTQDHAPSARQRR